MNKALLVTANIGLIFLGVALWRMPQAYVEEQAKQKAREQAELQEKMKPVLDSIQRQNEHSKQVGRELLENHKKFVEQNRRNLQETLKSSTSLPSTSPQTRDTPPSLSSEKPRPQATTPPAAGSPDVTSAPSSNTNVPQDVIDNIVGQREPGTYSPLVAPGEPLRQETPTVHRPK